MYKFAQRLHSQHAKLQMQEADRYLDDGEDSVLSPIWLSSGPAYLPQHTSTLPPLPHVNAAITKLQGAYF